MFDLPYKNTCTSKLTYMSSDDRSAQASVQPDQSFHSEFTGWLVPKTFVLFSSRQLLLTTQNE